MCLYSRTMRNKYYEKTKKNGGIIPPVYDERMLWVQTTCGNCMECRKQIANGWLVRLSEEIRHRKDGRFITLTFSDNKLREVCGMIKNIETLKGYERDNEIAVRAVRLFTERWRKKYKRTIRHWLVTELGHEGTENIHLHGIVWTDKPLEEVERIWQYGFVWKGQSMHGKMVNYVTQRTVNYITKYITKVDTDHMYYRSRTLASKGIGASYLDTIDKKRNEFNGFETNEQYKTTTGHKMALPTYYRNKIYDEEERRALWLQKLDKEVRYVGGEKISVKYGMEGYWRLVKWYRNKNRKLGYLDGDKDLDRVEYEQQKREELHGKRMQRAERNWEEERKKLEELYGRTENNTGR